MKKGKNDETLAKASKKNSNEVCLTEEELESASGGLETGYSLDILPDGNRIEKCTVGWKVLGIFPKKKTFNSQEEANNWLEKNGKIAKGFRFNINNS